MKRIIGNLIFVVVIFSFFAVAFANSGPVYWQGYPASDIMSIEKDSPIKVKGENLVFDFSDCENSDFTISGKVTAAYEMLNPTNVKQSVQMAFPFVGTIDSISWKDIVITADDSILPYEIYAGDVVENHGNPRVDEREASFDFARIVSTITDEPYKAENFSEYEKGKLYTIDVKPAAGQRINFAVDFNFDYKKTNILTNGFNRYERKDEKTRIAAWCDESEALEIYVLGEAVDFNINGYTDGELSEKIDSFTYQISTQEVELRSYLMERIKRNSNVEDYSGISETQLYNLYAKALDKYFKKNMGCISVYDIMEQGRYKRIMTLVYTVEFPPDSEKEVSVSYRASGTMDKRETAKPLYTFDYILNPAENWSDFKNLNIKIIASPEAPYIVKSSIELVKGENNVYTAALADLPEEDLFFTLYEDEKITLLDKAAGNLNNWFGYFYPIVIVEILLIIGIIIVVVIVKHLRGKKR